MVQNEITFENLPKAVAHLVSEVAEIKNLVCKGQAPIVPPKRIPIGIDDACKLIGKAKPTVYTLVRKRLLPCYKNGKHLYFFEDELLAWIEGGKKRLLPKSTRRQKLLFLRNILILPFYKYMHYGKGKN
ncbi:DNA binding domain, excisionase family [Prevotella disiens FB035-09AN]|uniref:DNA binding domain, excisionase family n=1 Tax=Prevotella disiens FB035-09AN TaxID=866771 RepID=E1KQF9_9BACT|nr:DNA binding domain, excisionase family [Prevotella disiens FB035-09AN]